MAKTGRTGVFGGTFDPVHNAHLFVARLARDAAALDRVIFMPAGAPPHKGLRQMMAPEHRIAMVRLAVEGVEGFEVSELEIATPGVDYTVDTLRALKRADPDADLSFIIGGDSLMYLDQWRDPGELLSQAAFVAVFRSDCSIEGLRRKRRELLERFGGEILLVECPGMDISSTQIRRMVAAGEDISGLVPNKVAEYIRQNGIYH